MMIYVQLAAVWLIIIGFVVWRAALLEMEQGEEDAPETSEPQCPICHQRYSTGEFRGTMPHVCPPGEG